MLLYGVGRTSFTPQIRRHSSAGQSARFTSVRSWVQVPLSPPKEKGTERRPFLLVQRHLAQPNAARCGRDFRLRLPALALCEGGNPDGFPLTLLFPSDPLGLRAASLRSKLVWLAGRSPGNAATSACAYRRSLYVWYLPSLPKANSLACQGLALAMLRFPLTLLFPSERLSLSDAEFAQQTRLACRAQSRQCRVPPHTPPPSLWRGFLHPTSGTIIRTVRKISPL